MNISYVIYGSIIVLLSGCAWGPTIVREPYEVQIPGPAMPCKVKVPVRPELATDAVPATAPDAPWLKAALGERLLLRGYALRLEAALQGCTGPP